MWFLYTISDSGTAKLTFKEQILCQYKMIPSLLTLLSLSVATQALFRIMCFEKSGMLTVTNRSTVNAIIPISVVFLKL